MKIVDVLPVKLGAVMYPEHDKVKSMLIDEINSHGNEYEYKKAPPVMNMNSKMPYIS